MEIKEKIVKIISDEYITNAQLKRVQKLLKKYQPKKKYYKFYLPIGKKSAKAIDEAITEQLQTQIKLKEE